MRHADISLSAPLHNPGLVFLVVLSVLWLGERPGLRQLAGVAAIMTGTYFLEPSVAQESIARRLKRLWQQRHIRYAVLAALLFSFTTIFDMHVVSSLLEPATYLFFLWLFIMVNFVLLEVSQFGAREIAHDLRVHGHLIFVVALFAFVSAYLLLLALAQAYVSYVIPLKSTSALFVTLVGGRMFGDPHLVRRAASCALMVAGAFLVAG